MDRQIFTCTIGLYNIWGYIRRQTKASKVWALLGSDNAKIRLRWQRTTITLAGHQVGSAPSRCDLALAAAAERPWTAITETAMRGEITRLQGNTAPGVNL